MANVEIRNFEPRLYQSNIASTCLKKNTLIILPTGLGKTKTALLVAVAKLNQFPNSKVLFLTVTKPLAEQIKREAMDTTTLSENEISLFIGGVKPEKREELWKNSRIIVSTPQCAANDIISKRIELNEVSLLVLDEVQNCIGDYDYVFVAENYHKNANFERIIGLTASPGSEVEKIKEICKNAFIERIEVRDEEDEDVKPYMQEMDIETIKVEFPKEFNEIKDMLRGCLKERINKLRTFGFKQIYSKKDLLRIQQELRKKVMAGEKNPLVWNGISLISEAIKIEHLLLLFETQGVDAAAVYLDKLKDEGKNKRVKSTKKVLADENFIKAMHDIDKLKENNIEHPKLEKLKDILKDEVKSISKIIVFNHYRDSAKKLVSELNKVDGIKAELFVGQTKKSGTGLNQKKQIDMINRFRNGEFNVIVMTSVGELGLDIPSVGLVVFYEPVPSAIRAIQRRGRTARHEKGKIKILVTKGTRDETYDYQSRRKERNMYKILKELRLDLSRHVMNNEGNKTLSNFGENFGMVLHETPKNIAFKNLGDFVSIKNADKNSFVVYADSREQGSHIIKWLAKSGVNVKLQNLGVGDFIVSESLGIERKSMDDFISSIIDNRLFFQLGNLKEKFDKPVFILEGFESMRNIHPNAIKGAIASIIADFRIPVIQTKDDIESAEFIKVLAEREQTKQKREFQLQKERKPISLSEKQEFILQSFPGIGAVNAKNLLEGFKSLKNIANANVDELIKIDGIGKKIAMDIFNIVNAEYTKE